MDCLTSTSQDEYVVEVSDSDGEYIVGVKKRMFIHVRESCVEDLRANKPYR